jgi:hypothetical protein
MLFGSSLAQAEVLCLVEQDELGCSCRQYSCVELCDPG